MATAKVAFMLNVSVGPEVLDMITVSLDWGMEEIGLDCSLCPRWSDEITDMPISMGALIRRALVHVREAHGGAPLAGGGGSLEGGAPSPGWGCSHGYRVGMGGQHLATNGACSDFDEIAADRPQNHGESAENRSESIDGAR